MSKKIILSLYLLIIYSDEFGAYTQAFMNCKDILRIYAQFLKVLVLFSIFINNYCAKKFTIFLND